jgi:serine/threonine-protein kinase
VADSGNSRVVKVDPEGTLQVVAGTGTWGVSGDGGRAASATFEFPRALAFSTVDGSLYVSDQNADLVRRLAP